ncbi:MAG: sulfotransferase [Pelagibacteraceae bacterium]|jgi:tetratricopeptide (TPR) repeat protein|nr:sulfotransferase [Pelagibacteraceae bacterium]
MNNSKIEAEREAQIILNYFKAKDYISAEVKAKKLIKKFPNFQALYNLLGLCLQSQKKFQEAIKYYKIAIQNNPNFFVAINNLGLTYYNMYDLKNAQHYYERAIEINPKFTHPISNLGNVKKELNNYEEAIKCYKLALSIDNKLYIVIHNLGMAYQALGKFEESKKYFESVLKINSKFTRADRSLSMSLKYDINNPHLKIMKNKIKDQSLNDFQKIELHFGLGKAYEDIKNYKKSFENYKLGNKIKRDSIKYQINDDVKLFENIKNSFSSIDFQNLENIGNKSNKMIFILGMPRSGTTLVEQIIANHKSVYGAGELRDLTQIIRKNFLVNNKIKFPEKFNIKDQNFFSNMGTKYLENLDRYNTNKNYITDKAPLNFKWIGLVKLILPKSKIIHCTRDPKDTCLSLFKNFFEGELNFSYNLEEAAKYYKLYQNLMKYWKQLLPDFIYNISYEKLVENQEFESKKLLDFCNLDWDKNCLTFYRNKRGIVTASFAQARKPIYKNSVKSWQNYKNELLPMFKILEK